jgi:hypothetical protein
MPSFWKDFVDNLSVQQKTNTLADFFRYLKTLDATNRVLDRANSKNCGQLCAKFLQLCRQHAEGVKSVAGRVVIHRIQLGRLLTCYVDTASRLDSRDLNAAAVRASVAALLSDVPEVLAIGEEFIRWLLANLQAWYDEPEPSEAGGGGPPPSPPTGVASIALINQLRAQVASLQEELKQQEELSATAEMEKNAYEKVISEIHKMTKWDHILP